MQADHCVCSACSYAHLWQIQIHIDTDNPHRHIVGVKFGCS